MRNMIVNKYSIGFMVDSAADSYTYSLIGSFMKVVREIPIFSLGSRLK